MTSVTTQSFGCDYRLVHFLVLILTAFSTMASASSPCDAHPCVNGGQCQNSNYDDNLKEYTDYNCKCPPYASGKSCQINSRQCAVNVCLNGGTCYEYTELGTSQYRCICVPPYEGDRCELKNSRQCPVNVCLNGGTCYDSEHGTSQYRCECTPSYVGDRCELKSNITCTAPDSVYRSLKLQPQSTISHYTFDGNPFTTCSKLANAVRNKPELVYNDKTKVVISMYQFACGNPIEKPAAYRLDFELAACEKETGANSAKKTFQSCCRSIPKCSSVVNPCLNGGTCYDYSNITSGDNYRCECPSGFVGNDCELKSNLTCSSTSPASLVQPTDYGSAFPSDYVMSTMDCSAAADYYRGRPQNVNTRFSDYVNQDCTLYSLLKGGDGHQFRQGVDGRIASDMFQFELSHCSRNDHATFMKFRGCCPSCLSSPCLNGGYCVQTNVSNYVCKCASGFGGRHCEQILSTCIATGSTHYQTFDLARIDYRGTCKFILVKSPNFVVYSRNARRNNATYPWYVEADVDGNVVRLVADGSPEAVVPVAVYVPYSSSSSNFNVSYDGTTVRYDTPFGLSVTFDGKWTIMVTVPTAYKGNVTGLCGNGDGDPDNDLTLANGTDVSNLTNAFEVVGDSYVVPDSEQLNVTQCLTPPQLPPCVGLSEENETACGILNSTSSAFASCVGRLGSRMAGNFADMCIEDACVTHGASTCSSIKAFVELCALNGVSVSCDEWQSATGCGARNYCPAIMTYKCSAPACLSTCSHQNASSACSQLNKDACICPPHHLLNNGLCTRSCPTGCIDSHQQLKPIGTSWRGPGCTMITCQFCPNCTLSARPVITSFCRPKEKCFGQVCVEIATPSLTTSRTSSARTKKTTTTDPNVINRKPLILIRSGERGLASESISTVCVVAATAALILQQQLHGG